MQADPVVAIASRSASKASPPESTLNSPSLLTEMKAMPMTSAFIHFKAWNSTRRKPDASN
jgi:hypothetical protein